jgi:hypothetical protein
MESLSDIQRAGVSAFESSGGQRYTFVLHLGENVSVGSYKTNVLMVPVTGTIVNVSAVAKVGPVGSAIILDINRNGTTIWSTQTNRLQIVSGETIGVQTLFNTTALSSGDLLTIDIDQIGSSVPGQEITVTLWTI